MKDFNYHINKFGNNTIFEPHYVTQVSPQYDASVHRNIPNCFAYGRYCSFPRYDIGIVDGKDIIMEDIRQKCMWKTDYNKFWDYMNNFYDKCVNYTSNFNINCSNEVADLVGIDKNNIDKCITDSFGLTTLNDNIYTHNNTLLDEEYLFRIKYEIMSFPTIMVNNRTLKGRVTGENILDAICASFKIKPKECLQIKSEDSISMGFIILIILLIIAINVIIVYICRTYINKRINERVEDIEISSKINSIVISYLALREK